MQKYVNLIVKRPVWLNGWVFVYELSGCGFESRCSHLNFRFRACFEQGVPWHSGNYRVWIHSETRTWHDKNIQTKVFMLTTSGKQNSINCEHITQWKIKMPVLLILNILRSILSLNSKQCHQKLYPDRLYTWCVARFCTICTI